jgi:hypothetical protein
VATWFLGFLLTDDGRAFAVRIVAIFSLGSEFPVTNKATLMFAAVPKVFLSLLSAMVNVTDYRDDA